MLSVVKDVVSAVYATTALISSPTSPSQTLGTPAVRTLSQRHRHVAGGSAEVLEIRIHADHGWR